MTEFGVITEQGDLGLGFDPLEKKDQQVYQEAVNKENSSKDNTVGISENKTDKWSDTH